MDDPSIRKRVVAALLAIFAGVSLIAIGFWATATNSLPTWDDTPYPGDYHRFGGVLAVEGDCLYLDGDGRRLPIWPRSRTKWDESTQVLTYSGFQYRHGDAIVFRAGRLPNERVDWKLVHPDPAEECDRSAAFFVGRPLDIGKQFALPQYEGQRGTDARIAGELVAESECMYVEADGVQTLVVWPRGTRWNVEDRFLEFAGARLRVGLDVTLAGSWYEGKVWLNDDLWQMPATRCDTTRTFLAVAPA